MSKMTDRELLELAAKAAGLNVKSVPINHPYFADGLVVYEHFDAPFPWNPLTDDGNCARLEVVCELQIDIGDLGVITERTDGIACFERYSDHDGDRNKTRRRASVRAAAEIGKTMEGL